MNYNLSIGLGELKLDPQNPRIPKSLRDSNPSEVDLINYMLLDASLIELMLAIGQNGYFPGEQLLVVKDNEDGKYKVVEGNRRLSAVKLLSNPALAEVQKARVQKVLDETTERPTEIPCLVFDDEQEIHKYLGFKHITGIKEWRLLEKSRYLYGLRESLFGEMSLMRASREIAKMIGSRTDYVRRVLVGYEVYKLIEDAGFYKIRDLNDTTFYFNYIVDSLNKNNIRSFIGVDFDLDNPIERISQTNLSKWTHWLFEKNDQNKTRLIGNSSDLSDLNAILGNENALKAFDEKGYSLERAKELTGELDEVFRNYVLNSLQSLEKADSLVVKVRDYYLELEEDLRQIKLISDKIKATAKATKDDE